MTNTISLCPLQADSAEIQLATKLYLEAFPSCERRDVDEWLDCLDKKAGKPFSLFAIVANDTFYGFISCWELTDFVYVEHFAVNENARGNGIGAQTIQELKKHYSTTPLVLEVELPNDDLSRRRIGFYQRQGFILNEKKYLQPPYRKSDDWFELKLMTTDPDFLAVHFEKVRKDIYQKAYNVTAE